MRNLQRAAAKLRLHQVTPIESWAIGVLSSEKFSKALGQRIRAKPVQWFAARACERLMRCARKRHAIYCTKRSEEGSGASLELSARDGLVKRALRIARRFLDPKSKTGMKVRLMAQYCKLADPQDIEFLYKHRSQISRSWNRWVRVALAYSKSGRSDEGKSEEREQAWKKALESLSFYDGKPKDLGVRAERYPGLVVRAFGAGARYLYNPGFQTHEEVFVECFPRAAEMDRQSAWFALDVRFDFHRQHKNLDYAKRILKLWRSLEKGLSPSALASLYKASAEMCEWQRNVPGAITELEKILALESIELTEKRRAHLMIGDLLVKTRDSQRAAEHFSTAHEMEGAEPVNLTYLQMAQIGLLRCALVKDDRARAVRIIREGQKHFANDSTALQEYLLASIGALLEYGRVNMACTELKALHELVKQDEGCDIEFLTQLYLANRRAVRVSSSQLRVNTLDRLKDPMEWLEDRIGFRSNPLFSAWVECKEIYRIKPGESRKLEDMLEVMEGGLLACWERERQSVFSSPSIKFELLLGKLYCLSQLGRDTTGVERDLRVLMVMMDV